MFLNKKTLVGYASAMRFSQPATARQINRLRVLNLVLAEGQLSRADIARMLDLNKPSTSEIVELLIAEHLLEEQGKTITTNGRRPTALSLNSSASLVLGVDIASHTTSFSLSDLKGNIFRFERLPNPPQPSPKEHGQQIIRTCMKLVKLAKNPVTGIVVSIAGIIDEEQQTLLSHDYWSWKNVPLAKAIEVNTKIPTIMVNNVEAMVVAERWFASEKENSFFFVNWAEHINAALVDGTTIKAQGSRFGHLPLASTGLCRCGNIGCLETLASGWALGEKHQGAGVKQLAQSTDKQVVEDLRSACQAMAMALIAASSITGCRKIILAGGISNLDDSYLGIVQSFFKEHAHHQLSQISIVRSGLSEQSAVLGSVAVALDRWVFQRSLLETMSKLQ